MADTKIKVNVDDLELAAEHLEEEVKKNKVAIKGVCASMRKLRDKIENGTSAVGGEDDDSEAA